MLVEKIDQTPQKTEYFHIWQYIEQLDSKDFKSLKQLSDTRTFGIVAAKLGDTTDLLWVRNALRELQVPLSDQEAERDYPETKLAVAAITHRIFERRGW